MRNKHAKNEAEYVSMMEKSKVPEYYTALSSDNASEEWFLIPMESHAKHDELLKLEEKVPNFSKTEERILEKDGRYVRRWDTIDTAHHPELSTSAFPDMTKARCVELTIFRVRPGQEDGFAGIIKAYLAAKKRVAPTFDIQTYEVLAEMPGPTYIGVSSLQTFGEYDQRIADEAATFEKANSEEKTVFSKWGNVIINTETQCLTVDPVQSHVPKEVRARDPAFWLKR